MPLEVAEQPAGRVQQHSLVAAVAAAVRHPVPVAPASQDRALQEAQRPPVKPVAAAEAQAGLVAVVPVAQAALVPMVMLLSCLPWDWA